MKRFKNRATAVITDVFGIDTRTLALFRCGLATLLLCDLWDRSATINAFYTDQGILPRTFLFTNPTRVFLTSLHMMGGSVGIQTFLFILQGLFAFALLVGYRTRLATCLSWIFLVSLQDRNLLILQGGDDYIRLLFFWAMFIPLGNTFSLDRLWGRVPESPRIILSGGTAAILMQSVFVYWTTAALKWKYPVWHDGSAVYYALNLDLLCKPFSRWFLASPPLMKLLTQWTIYLEFFGPFLLLSPFFTKKARMVGALCFISLHLGFNACLRLFPFPEISMLAMVLFFPSAFWEFFGGQKSPPDTSAGVYKPSLLGNSVALTLLACCTLWNLESVFTPTVPRPRLLQTICMSLHIDQNWQMFVDPGRLGGFFIVGGKLKSGEWIDMMDKGAPMSWGRNSSSMMLTNSRWNTLSAHLTYQWHSELWPTFCNYICHSLPPPFPQDSLQSVSIILMGSQTPPQDKIKLYSKKVLYSYDCR